LPKVSVITAAYNHVQFVRQSVESVLNQTYRDFEHIVVDDGSSDGTAEVLKTFGDRIKYIRQANRGAHAAINAGIRESSGEYIAILDSDDAWLPHKLERQMPAFEESPEAGMVYAQACIIDGQSNLKNNGAPEGKPVINSQRAFEELLQSNFIPVLTAVIRRDCLEDVGFFKESLKALSDWDLWLRIALKWPIVFIPEPLGLYRLHGSNTFASLSEAGQVNREQLLIMRETPVAGTGNAIEVKRRKHELNARFTFTVMRQTYGLSYRREYSKALGYLLFAFRLRPTFLKDLPAALSLEPALFERGRPLGFIENLLRGIRDN
jgi:glycosyltransferase involved in cell wall biosynthesis